MESVKLVWLHSSPPTTGNCRWTRMVLLKHSANFC